ncbi:MAG: hypothetical protein ACPG7F_00440 [Aggregatilineales bacterium]
MSKPDTDTINAWEQLPDGTETDRAYEAFCIYRDMGVLKRSHRAVNDVMYSDKDNIRYIAIWSTENNWVERVQAWDAYQRDERQKRNQARQIEIEDNAYEDYQFLRNKISDAIVHYEASPLLKISDMRMLLGLMHEADDYGRRAVGLPGKISQNTNDNHHTGKVDATGSLADVMADVFKEMADYEAGGGDDSPSA